MTLHPDALEDEQFRKEFQVNPPLGIVFSSSGKHLGTNLTTMNLRSVEILAIGLTVEEAENYVDVPFPLNFSKLKHLPDEIAEILLKHQSGTSLPDNLITSYLTAKLFLKNAKEQNGDTVIVTLRRHTSEIAKAFQELGLYIYFSGNMSISEGSMAIYSGTQKSIDFDNCTGLPPHAARDLIDFKGYVNLRCTTLAPQTAVFLSQLEGPLWVSAIIPDESLEALMSKRGSLTITIKELGEYNIAKKVEIMNRYEGEDLTVRNDCTSEIFRIFARNISTPVKFQGSIRIGNNWYTIQDLENENYKDQSPDTKKVLQELKALIEGNTNI